MSEPDDDRDLDAFLRRQSPIADAWRAASAGTRAPAEADAAILAAARAAVATRPAARRHRWRLPIGLAASLVVGIGVLREVERDPRASNTARVEAPVVASAPPPPVASAPAYSEAEPPPAAVADAAPADRADMRRALERARRAEAASARRRDASEDAALRALQTMREQEAVRAAAPAPLSTAPATPLTPLPPETAVAATPSTPAAAASMKAETRASGAVAGASAQAPALREPQTMALPSTVASFRGLRFDVATRDDAIARFGAPSAARAIGEGGTSPLEYDRTLDPRGRLRLDFGAAHGLFEQATLLLDPPLPLADLTRDEDLVPGPGCREGADEPLFPGEPGTLEWPSRGIELRLGDDGRVVSIRYRAGCR